MFGFGKSESTNKSKRAAIRAMKENRRVGRHELLIAVTAGRYHEAANGG
jgi:hypothetical protein